LSAPVVLINEFDRMLQPCRKDPKGLFRGQSHQDHPTKVTSNSVRRNLKRVSAGNRARWSRRKLARGSNHNFRASTLWARSRCEKEKSAKLVPIGVREQARDHVADRRADTQRDVKQSDKLQCRHGRLSPTRATHIAHLCRSVWCKHTGRDVPSLTINSGCPLFKGRGNRF